MPPPPRRVSHGAGEKLRGSLQGSRGRAWRPALPASPQPHRPPTPPPPAKPPRLVDPDQVPGLQRLCVHQAHHGQEDGLPRAGLEHHALAWGGGGERGEGTAVEQRTARRPRRGRRRVPCFAHEAAPRWSSVHFHPPPQACTTLPQPRLPHTAAPLSQPLRPLQPRPPTLAPRVQVHRGPTLLPLSNANQTPTSSFKPAAHPCAARPGPPWRRPPPPHPPGPRPAPRRCWPPGRAAGC